MNIIEFIKENQVWVVPIIVAVLSGIIAGIFNLLSKMENIINKKWAISIIVILLTLMGI